jgi:hypothetical protein
MVGGRRFRAEQACRCDLSQVFVDGTVAAERSEDGGVCPLEFSGAISD